MCVGRTAAMVLKSVEYEIFGTVQGVFFRKYTQEQATRIGLVGWCQNTYINTVKGLVQGEEEKVNAMKDWLRYKGSPMSKITKAEFYNEKSIEKIDYQRFFIRH